MLPYNPLTNNEVVTTSAEVGSSPCSGGARRGARRRRSSSHHGSTFIFPCVLSCFSSHLVFISLITCCVFIPLFPPCLCVGLFIVVLCARSPWAHNGLFLCLFILLFWMLLVLHNKSPVINQFCSLAPDFSAAPATLVLISNCFCRCQNVICLGIDTVHSESIQTPWLFPHFVTLQSYSSIYTQYPIMT